MPTEYACQIDTDGVAGVSGVDFTSLSAWYDVLRGGGSLFVRPTNPLVVPGTMTGAVAAGATVTQATTGKVGKFLHSKSGSALVALNSHTDAYAIDDTHAWQVDGSNYWTPTGPRDCAVLVANCRGTAADPSSIDWSLLTSKSLQQAITVVGNLDPAALIWDATKYRLSINTLLGAINVPGANTALRFVNLQVENTSTATGSWTDQTSAYHSDGNTARFEGCILRGGRNVADLFAFGGNGRFHALNCMFYGATRAAVLHRASYPAHLQNVTAIGGTNGVLATSTGGVLAENTYAHGTAAAYSATGTGTIDLTNRAASSDSTGTAGYRSIAHSAATFANVTAGSQDYRLAIGSPLARVGLDLSPGRSRTFCDVSSADEGNAVGGSPIGILAFEVGSSVAVFRLYHSFSDLWFDGTGTNNRRYDLSRSITLPNPSTTGDWVALVSDTHVGTAGSKAAFGRIDGLNAGTRGRWTRDTSLGWTLNSFPCSGRLKHLIVIGDLGPTDTNRFGTARNDYQDNLWNTSAEAGTFGVASIPHADTWHLVGNHDTTVLMAPWNPTNPGNPGFESFRLNQHGRTLNDAGAAYSDVDELRQSFTVGNNTFLMLGLLGSSDVPHSTGLNLAAWNAADIAWATGVIDAVPSAHNLLIFPHAPMTQSSRQSWENRTPPAVDLRLARAPWAASFCGHTHAFDLMGPDSGSASARADFPTRSDWSIGAGTPSPLVPTRRPARGGGRAFRSIRA